MAAASGIARAAAQAVLFDLDGTLADTAPDLTHALNRMRQARSLPALPVAVTRPVTSLGARGMLGVGFGLKPSDDAYPALREEFLRLYEQRLCHDSTLFPGMGELLAALERRGIAWGVVTNKAERYAKPLIAAFGLAARCGCIVGGDTTAHTKPHPAPLLAASTLLRLAPEACIYVGDDSRDIDAGRAAGMATVAVRYGYLNGGQPDTWGADAVIDHPGDLLRYL